MDRPVVTYLLALANIAVFVYGAVTGMHEQWLALYAFTGERLFAGNLLPLLAAGFLHLGVAHLLYNVVFLVLFGVAAEPVFGATRTAGLFLGGIIAGNLAFAALFPAEAAIGASGGVFAVLAAGTLLKPAKHVHGLVPVPLSIVAVFYILGAVGSVFTLAGGVAHIAHVSGAVVGAALSFYWAPKRAGKGLLLALSVLVFLAAIGIINL